MPYLTKQNIQKSLGKISLTSDLWSDMNLTPFMAVTAHWIEGEEITTPQGPQYKLILRTYLIGFHRVPGRHNGDHLACAFLYVLDRVDIADKVLWLYLPPSPDSNRF
jgi:hypothetical protein